MKTEIQPNYYLSKVTCACGHTFEVGSTQKEIRLDICSECHPFFTGKQKFVDTAGRVDKYFRKYGDDAQKKFKKKKTKRRVVQDEADLQAMLSDDGDVLDAVASEVAETAAPADKTDTES
jgi:large subunit ribosomal protein L31